MIKELFTPIPKKRGIYAFTRNKRGEFLIYIENDDLCYNFMQLPDRFPISLSKKTFESSISTKLLEYIEQLPEDVYTVCIANLDNKNSK